MKIHGGQQCTICTHPKRNAIERAIVVERAPQRVVADRFGLSKTTVLRHSRHLPPEVVKMGEAARDPVRERLDAEIEMLIKRTRNLHRTAQRGRDVGPQLRVIQQLKSLLELRARVLGQLSDGAHSEIHLNITAERALAVAQVFVTRHQGARDVVADK